MAFVRILKLCSYLCEQHVLLAYRHFFFFQMDHIVSGNCTLFQIIQLKI